jgi:hypothetical protein
LQRPIILISIVLLAASAVGAHAAQEIATFRTKTAVFGIDGRGFLSTLTIKGREDCLAPGQPAPLLSVRQSDRVIHAPDRAEWDAAAGRLTLHYTKAGVTAVVSVVAKPTHVVFKLMDVATGNPVDLVIWGPYPMKIHDIVGETVGVVRDPRVAAGIQSLNPKTIGGLPDNDNDEESGNGEPDPGVYADLSPELKRDNGWRGGTARAMPWGSTLQAYCRDRSADRVIRNWGWDKFPAPAYPDGGVRGSAIALFACPAAKALPTIGEIEVAEGLPHPMIDGVWGKMSPAATASYLIVDFSESNVDRAIEMTRRAGLKYLYHSSPFATWGHFQLMPNMFPHGWDGLKQCADKARAAGIRIGFHTLSNFITPNDAYVRPVPSAHLAKACLSKLDADVDAQQTVIPIRSDDAVLMLRNTDMNTVMIGRELIRFKSGDAPTASGTAAASLVGPCRLLGCERGAWGTQAEPHKKGEAVARLADHSYKVFLGDAELSQETARNIGKLFNYTGAMQTSFDGLEGNQSTGLGVYGSALFTQAWYDVLNPELKGRVINDASNPGHYTWHIYTRMNWGEPWYAGFRESQTLYRFKNQVYFERNFTPHMLGWFALQPDTSVEDAEWLLARAAGFDAGFCLMTSIASTAQLQADPSSAEAAKRYGATTAILDLVKLWETARMAGAFPEKVKALLRDNDLEFHLERDGANGWKLFQAHITRGSCDLKAATTHAFEFVNPDRSQPLRWIISSTAKEPVTALTIALDDRALLCLAGPSLPAGGYLKYSGGREAVVYDASWHEQARIPIDEAAARVSGGALHGAHTLRFTSASPIDGKLKLELRTYKPPIHIARRLSAGQTAHN